MESPEYIFFYNQFIVLRLEDGTVSLILNVHFKGLGLVRLLNFLLTKAAFI